MPYWREAAGSEWMNENIVGEDYGSCQVLSTISHRGRRGRWKLESDQWWLTCPSQRGTFRMSACVFCLMWRFLDYQTGKECLFTLDLFNFLLWYKTTFPMLPSRAAPFLFLLLYTSFTFIFYFGLHYLTVFLLYGKIVPMKWILIHMFVFPETYD